MSLKRALFVLEYCSVHVLYGIRKKGESMLLTFGLLSKSEVDALREKGFPIFFAEVDENNQDWIEDVLKQKVNEAKVGDASFCLFVNVNSDGFVDALAEGNHVEPEVVERCMGIFDPDEFLNEDSDEFDDDWDDDSDCDWDNETDDWAGDSNW